MTKFKVLEYNNKIDISVKKDYYVRKELYGALILGAFIYFVVYSTGNLSSDFIAFIILLESISIFYFIQFYKNENKETIIINHLKRSLSVNDEILIIKDDYFLISRRHHDTDGDPYYCLYLLDNKQELKILKGAGMEETNENSY